MSLILQARELLNDAESLTHAVTEAIEAESLSFLDAKLLYEAAREVEGWMKGIREKLRTDIASG